MKDYYNLFVELSLQQCMKADYTNKLKLKEHNKASKKLQQLQLEMQSIDCVEILSMLLSHNDHRVKINAVALCLKMDVLIDRSHLILKNIIDTSDDPKLCFSAKMMLAQL